MPSASPILVMPVGARGIGEPPVASGCCAVLNAISSAVGDEVFVRAPVLLDHIVKALETRSGGSIRSRQTYRNTSLIRSEGRGQRAKRMNCPLLSALCTLLLLSSCSQPPPKPTQQTIIWEHAGTWSGRGNMETNSFPAAGGYLRFTWETRTRRSRVKAGSSWAWEARSAAA